MLEDNRGHSPLPDEHEIRWMAARPFRHAAVLALLALVAMLVANAPSFAVDKAIVIASAACDSHHRTVQVDGRNLVSGGLQPAVHLEGHPRPLQVMHVSDARIVARLPEGLADGAYLITLRRGAKVAEWREIAVVLGVVGPAIVD